MTRRHRRLRLPSLALALLLLLLGGASFIYACSDDSPSSTLGQPCSASEPCGPDSICDQQLGVCVSPRKDGGPGGDAAIFDGGGDGASRDGMVDASSTGG